MMIHLKGNFFFLKHNDGLGYLIVSSPKGTSEIDGELFNFIDETELVDEKTARMQAEACILNRLF